MNYARRSKAHTKMLLRAWELWSLFGIKNPAPLLSGKRTMPELDKKPETSA